MLAVFLLQNQYDQYLSKSGEWLDGADSKTLYRTVHKDEAINQKVEVAVKQADTRAKIVNGFQLPNGQVILSENEPLPIAPEPVTDSMEEPSSDSVQNEETVPEEASEADKVEQLAGSNNDTQPPENTTAQLSLSGDPSTQQFTA